jgi:hypothetical protein
MEKYLTKEQLFIKLKQKGIFWSFSNNISFDDMNENIFIEYVLKYGDFDDLASLFNLYPHKFIKEIWISKLKSDKSFIKTNMLIARVFFNMDVESSYFKDSKNERFEKLRMLAS